MNALIFVGVKRIAFITLPQIGVQARYGGVNRQRL